MFYQNHELTFFPLLIVYTYWKIIYVPLAYEPKDTGFALMTALTDPDGNYIEFTQLSDRWFKHIEKRRGQGFDVLTRWQSSKSK